MKALMENVIAPQMKSLFIESRVNVCSFSINPQHRS